MPFFYYNISGDLLKKTCRCFGVFFLEIAFGLYVRYWINIRNEDIT